MQHKKTLVVDQSSTCCGFAVLNGRELEAHGILTSREKDSMRRLLDFWKDLRQLAQEHRIDEIVIEHLHYNGGQFTSQATQVEPLAGSSVICRFTAVYAGIPLYRIRPQTWKAAIGARGTRDTIKQDVCRKVCQYWGLDEEVIKSSDHSDALGIAACWLVYAADIRAGLKK